VDRRRAKRRWIRLPPGSAIDASDPDRWVFPVGTQLWKEFAFERRVETRYMQLGSRRPSGRYATYVWSVDGRDATLAPTRGLRGACELAGGARHDIPEPVSTAARATKARPTSVLGFGALQLSSDRDPLAPHATQRTSRGASSCAELVERGLVRNLPTEFTTNARHGSTPATARERAALGYLHGELRELPQRARSARVARLDLE
jgi:hypothetical protein